MLWMHLNNLFQHWFSPRVLWCLSARIPRQWSFTPTLGGAAFLSQPLAFSAIDGLCHRTKSMSEVLGLPALDSLNTYTFDCSLCKSNSFLNLICFVVVFFCVCVFFCVFFFFTASLTIFIHYALFFYGLYRDRTNIGHWFMEKNRLFDRWLRCGAANWMPEMPSKVPQAHFFSWRYSRDVKLLEQN